MREVLPLRDRTDTVTKALVLTVVDHHTTIPAAAGTLVWSPEDTGTGTCSWDMLAAITDTAQADALCEHLFAVVEDEPALYFVPEASLLTANLLLAAARGRRSFDEVISWIQQGEVAVAAANLALAGDDHAVADLDAFTASSGGERAAIWAVVRQVMLPLGSPAARAALGSGEPGAACGRGPLTVLDTAYSCAAVRHIYVVAAPGSGVRGVVNAFCAHIVAAAAHASVPVWVEHAASWGPR